MSAANCAIVRSDAPDTFCSQLVESVFAECFLVRSRSQLVGGATEPLYQPATGAKDIHTLHYREDFFASALHEVAHWCLAGERRRLLKDYGYWYSPDGRDSAAQREFENVEYKPQALEWIFAKACSYPFRISADNLDCSMIDLGNDVAFRQRVMNQAQLWCLRGLPQRAQLFFRALCDAYGRSVDPGAIEFSMRELD